MAPSFVSKLRRLVSLNRGGKSTAKGDKEDEGIASGSEDEREAEDTESEGDHNESGRESEDEDEDDASSDGTSLGFGEEEGNSRRGHLLEPFDDTGLSSSLRFAVKKVFEKKEAKDALCPDDDDVLEASQAGQQPDAAARGGPHPLGQPSRAPDGDRAFSRNPYYSLSCLVGSCLDKSLHLLIRKDFVSAAKQLETVGALPETVAPSSPLCRSAEHRPADAKRGKSRSRGLRGAEGPTVSAASRFGPACWGLPHTVFAIDRRRLKALRDAIEGAEGSQRAFQFSLTLYEFSSDDLDTLDGPRKQRAEKFYLSTMVSIQRTALGCFSGSFSHTRALSDKYLSLASSLPAVVGLQEDVVVSGSYLTGALATFVQHLMLQVQDLMDTRLHVVEGLYITDRAVHPATFRVGQFDENRAGGRGKAANRGIKFGLSEMFDTVDFRGGETKTSLSFVKAVKRAVLQQKVITLSVVLHVGEGGQDSSAGKAAKNPRRLMRIVKRYVFHHDGMTEENMGPDAISHYSADAFEAIYSGVFLSQKAVRRYMQLYESSPMEAVVFEPNLARRKDVISDLLSRQEVGPALCETLSYALLEWSQDVYNTQSSVNPSQVHQIVRAIVEGHDPAEDEDEEFDFDENHMSLLTAVVELVLLDSSLASQLSVIASSAEVVLDILSAGLKESAGDEVSFLMDADPAAQEQGNKPKGDKEIEDEIKKEVVNTIKKKVVKGKGFDFLMDHVQDIARCLGQLDQLGILELASSSDDSKIVGKSLSKTLDIVKENPGHAFLLMNQLYRAAHLIKSCSNILSLGFFHELRSANDLLLDVRSKYLQGSKKAPSKRKHRRGEKVDQDKGSDETGKGEGRSEDEATTYPLALSPVERAQPGIIEDLQIAANSGLELVLGGLIWSLLQPPIPVDPYPKCIKLLKGAASALELNGKNHVGEPETSVARAVNQLTMLGNDPDRAENVNPLFPVYLTRGTIGNTSSDVVYGSYTALQYCCLQSVSAFTSLLMEQILVDMLNDDGDSAPSTHLWHFLGVVSFRRGTCNVDIVQSIDGSMSIGNLMPSFRSGEAEGKRSAGLGLQTVCEYYLVRGNSGESMKEASVLFAKDVISHIRAYVTVGQSHVLENTEARRKGGLILDIQVNHPDFLYEDKQKLLRGILDSDLLKGIDVESHEDPFHKLLEKASYRSLGTGKTAQILSILVAQEHPTLGYIPVVKSIYLSYSGSQLGRDEGIPAEAHSQVFIDEASALTWHNWFDQASYNACRSEFIGSISQSKALGVDRDTRNAEQFTSSLYNLRMFTKGFDSQTQLFVDMLRACVASQETDGVEFLGNVLGLECLERISGIMTSAIPLQAFLDGKSIHLQQLLTTDMHGEMLKRVKTVLEDLIEAMRGTVDQDWAKPISRPIEIFLHKSKDIKDTIMRGSFDFAVSHVRSVLVWGIESSNYISSAIGISARERLESILDTLARS